MNVQVSYTGGLSITVPYLRRFTKEPVCRTCGYAGRGWFSKLRAWVRGKRPKLGCGVYRHCPGSKPPSEERNLGFILGGTNTVENNCAGLFHAHLHVACARCGDHWLMASADDK